MNMHFSLDSFVPPSAYISVGDSATYLYINEVLISSAKVAIKVRGLFDAFGFGSFSCFFLLFASMTRSDVLFSGIFRIMTRVAFRSYLE